VNVFGRFAAIGGELYNHELEDSSYEEKSRNNNNNNDALEFNSIIPDSVFSSICWHDQLPITREEAYCVYLMIVVANRLSTLSEGESESIIDLFKDAAESIQNARKKIHLLEYIKEHDK